jgi:hypothetical protein
MIFEALEMDFRHYNRVFKWILMGHSGLRVGSQGVQSQVTAGERPDPLPTWVQTHG